MFWLVCSTFQHDFVVSNDFRSTFYSGFIFFLKPVTLLWSSGYCCQETAGLKAKFRSAPELEF